MPNYALERSVRVSSERETRPAQRGRYARGMSSITNWGSDD